MLGEARIAASFPVTLSDLRNNAQKHRIQDLSIITYSKPHAWVMREAHRYKVPQPYKHPQGAVVWIDLILKKQESVSRKPGCLSAWCLGHAVGSFALRRVPSLEGKGSRGLVV